MDSMSGHELIESQSAVSPVSPLRPAPIPSSQMMAASQYYATTPPSLLQYHGREVANSATKAKLSASGNGMGGKSGSDHKTSDQVVTDQAREILRQAVVSGLVENAAAAAAAAAAKGGAGSAPNAKSEGAARYIECQKNHAAGIGGHALDGCGEFMPSGDDDDALRCAACDCHRNFHRRELDSAHDCKAAQRKAPRPLAPMPTPAPRPAHLALQYSAHTMTPLAMAAAMSAGEATDSDDPADAAPGSIMHVGLLAGSAAQKLKRFRTKFSSEQKDQMCAFSEKLGWRIQKHDEPAVQEFCSAVGVKRHVLKVWMHNNKHTMGKKLLP